MNPDCCPNKKFTLLKSTYTVHATRADIKTFSLAHTSLNHALVAIAEDKQYLCSKPHIFL